MPSSDQTRLEILRDLEILDTPPDIELDEITKLAALLISAPIALVSLVDETRQWFKSKFGISVNETPRDISFCTHAIENGDLFEIPNALEDSRFRENPLVTSEPFVRFYAGVPLRLEKGAIGTLCVIDQVPRRLTVEQREGLILLARQVTHHLIWRKVFRTYLRLKDSVESQTSGWLLEDHREQPIFLNGGLLSLFGLTMDRGKFRHSDLAPFFQDPAGFVDRTKDCREKLHSIKNQEFQLADGRWIEREYIPRLSGESVDAHIWTYRDITERKKNSILLEYQKAQMVEGQRLSSLGEMAAGLAHEINNPLTVIYGRAAHL
jgi:PAS domain-containing protein